MGCFEPLVAVELAAGSFVALAQLGAVDYQVVWLCLAPFH
jgi:hypothetical protein